MVDAFNQDDNDQNGHTQTDPEQTISLPSITEANNPQETNDQNGHTQTDPEQIISLPSTTEANDPQETFETEKTNDKPNTDLARSLPLTIASDPEGLNRLAEINKADVWSWIAFFTFLSFSLVSIGSTFISTQLLITLLSGGSGVTIPFLWTQISVVDAVSAMGTGILESASYSDAYLDEYKKSLERNKKKASQLGRFLAFIAQSSLYYMALGSLLFQSAPDFSNWGQKLEDTDTPTTALVLTPPTPLHGIFVGTVSIAWSFGTIYLGPTALIMAIASLRRKPKSEEASEPLPQSEAETETEDRQKSLDGLKELIKQIGQQMKQKVIDLFQEQERKSLDRLRTESMKRITEEMVTLQNLLNAHPSDQAAAAMFDELFETVLNQVQDLVCQSFEITPEEAAEVLRNPSANREKSLPASQSLEPKLAPVPISWWFDRNSQ